MAIPTNRSELLINSLNSSIDRPILYRRRAKGRVPCVSGGGHLVNAKGGPNTSSVSTGNKLKHDRFTATLPIKPTKLDWFNHAAIPRH